MPTAKQLRLIQQGMVAFGVHKFEAANDSFNKAYNQEKNCIKVSVTLEMTKQFGSLLR